MSVCDSNGGVDVPPALSDVTVAHRLHSLDCCGVQGVPETTSGAGAAADGHRLRTGAMT